MVGHDRADRCPSARIASCPDDQERVPQIVHVANFAAPDGKVAEVCLLDRLRRHLGPFKKRSFLCGGSVVEASSGALLRRRH